MERTAFLHASDIFDARHADTGIEAPRTDNIRALVAEGNEILVQVVKDPLGTKGLGSRPTSRCRRAILCTCRRVRAWVCRRASRMRPNATGCAARCWRESRPTKARAISCVPPPKTRVPKPCWPTCNTCASCGKWCGTRDCARSRAIWCTRGTCRCICGCYAIFCGRMWTGC